MLGQLDAIPRSCVEGGRENGLQSCPLTVSLIPILIIVEIIRLFFQPLALAVGLTANITTGHLLKPLIAGITLGNTVSSYSYQKGKDVLPTEEKV